ncbi:hypothetical protein A2773_02135 [Candidatus Gottesmanbacteria bacterium RIFCSPHIGHO2_01_FULL_39_10]|uniref:DUF8173 domain-containing protein n=1 Tax=Candidatus Gottesmanbacteria bacterium RIFCSPHIGHO2_01_FULL_39_10 TaxID=1798375 RepID=A0A1F5ZQA7_9BACT|nr:MAG: hypothetical protein A2773_02135 [Candidatus Gottesmanbacteria bacterium RIFCSPHIGHO2_01_FULL_39_10]
MNKFYRVVSIIFILFLSFFKIGQVYGQTPTGAPQNIVVSDYFKADSSVVVDQNIAGDAFVAGGTILINGSVGGDLLVAGGNVTITGDVMGDIRAAGGSVILNGNVGRNLTVFGGDINIEKSAKIAGNVLAMGGKVNIDGKVGGKVQAQAGNLTLGENASIAGDLEYTSDKTAEIAKTATVSGAISYHALSKTVDVDEARRAAKGGLAAFTKTLDVVSLITSLFIGIIFIKLFPTSFGRMNDVLEKDPVKVFLVSIISFVVFPIFLVLLTLTIIGIPLSITLLILWFILNYIARIPIAFFIGNRILKKLNLGEKRGWALVVGILIYYLVGQILVLGFVAKFVASTLGLGMILIEKYNFYKTLRADKKI